VGAASDEKGYDVVDGEADGGGSGVMVEVEGGLAISSVADITVAAAGKACADDDCGNAEVVVDAAAGDNDGVADEITETKARSFAATGAAV
jgi:hypothetical protein